MYSDEKKLQLSNIALLTNLTYSRVQRIFEIGMYHRERYIASCFLNIAQGVEAFDEVVEDEQH